jgi:hypothetical protein
MSKTIEIEKRTDHLGKVYETIKDMCKEWNIIVSTYQRRIKLGWSKEEALTGIRNYSLEKLEERTDHEGIVYETIKAMCKKWSVSLDTYLKRILKYDWTKEEALTGVRNYSLEELEKRTDHEGVVYETAKAMYAKWNITENIYAGRLRGGWTKEEALTGIRNYSLEELEERTDHEGVVYETKTAMCKKWNISPYAYHGRLKHGWTKEEALTGIRNYSDEEIEKRTDHEGVIYKTANAMYKKWNITKSIYQSRVKLGWTKEEALTGIRNYSDEEIEKRTDHEGVVYKTVKAMCNKWNIIDYVYFNRLYYGWTKEEALTGVRKYSDEEIEKRTDHEGVVYETVKDMCDRWNVLFITYCARLERGWTKEEALTGVRNYSDEELEERTDHKGVVHASQIAMCKKWNIAFSTYKGRIGMGWTKEEALTIPKNMSLGEKRVMDVLESRNVMYFYNVSIHKALKALSLEVFYNDFIYEFQKMLKQKADLNWDITKIKKLRPDFILYKNNDGKIVGIIEYDGKQHQNYIEIFFKTIENFLKRNNVDYIKNSLWEYLNIPMLRIRDDQINLINEMVDDFLTHPENYITKHNTYLTEEEYWAPLIENYGNLDIAFSF